MTTEQRQQFKDLMKDVTKETFVAGYNPTDEERIGMILSKYFEWDGIKIMQTAYWALEDSNFHRENETIQELIDKAKGDYKDLGDK